MFGFQKKYFLATLLLFAVEVCIALFVRDRFIRPYLGDVLAVMLLYCFIKSFLILSPLMATVGVLLFAFTLEMLQFLNIVELLGLQENKVAVTVLGSQFDWQDLLAYVMGAIIILLLERRTANL